MSRYTEKKDDESKRDSFKSVPFCPRRIEMVESSETWWAGNRRIGCSERQDASRTCSPRTENGEEPSIT